MQCDYPYIRPGDELLHIFTHHIGKTEDELCEILRGKMLQHLNWLEQISEVVLREVNVSLEDYIDTITMPGVPLDFVALLFLWQDLSYTHCRIHSKGCLVDLKTDQKE